MNRFLKLSGEEKREVFQAASLSMGLRPDIVEKDFWVCFMLHHLFHDCKYKDAFVFKGGTSLSKAYHVIERFSEDIDIILDWRKIVPTDDNPWNDRSKTKQDQYNKLVNAGAAEFYASDLLPCLNSELEDILGSGQWFVVDENDEMVINFYYPQLFDRKVTEILTIDVERTFWEKLTILHKMANFPANKNLPPRYARHLYDVYCMTNSPVKEQAFARKELLEKDVIFKQKFYYAKSAHYETATLKEISLIPADHIMDAVKQDYAAMKNMIYGDYPGFETIIEQLKELEMEVHNL